MGCALPQNHRRFRMSSRFQTSRLFRRFFRHSKPATPAVRSKWLGRVEALEERSVPAVFNVNSLQDIHTPPMPRLATTPSISTSPAPIKSRSLARRKTTTPPAISTSSTTAAASPSRINRAAQSSSTARESTEFSMSIQPRPRPRLPSPLTI
jgi:hypothetical protein